MPEVDTSHLLNGERKVNEKKKSKKRKFTMDGQEGVLNTNKKKKFSPHQNNSESHKNNSKFKLYENNEYYGKVIANPKMLPSTPSIFNSKNQTTRKDYSLSDSFFVKFLTPKCFESGGFSSSSFIQETQQKTPSVEKSKIKERETEIKSIRTDNENFSEEKKKNKKVNVSVQSGVENSDNEEPEACKSKVDVYKIQNKKGILFHLHHPSTFSFFGEIEVTLVTGEVEILGFNLNDLSDLKTVKVYSPNFCTPLIIESKQPKQNKSKEELKNILNESLSQEDINKFLEEFNPSDSVVIVEQIVSSFGIVMNKYFEKEIFPKTLENVPSETESLELLLNNFNFKMSSNTKHIKINEAWERIPLGQCTILCGGKGVGKSTLLKYYINKLVSKGEKVLCLDFDPGQSEFTAPGFVSATLLDKPILGPNFTHVTEPEIKVYFGEVDVSQGPAKYLECVKYIIEFCQQNKEFLKLKWFVNSMGFSKGLGVELMISTLKLLKPNTVIEIRSSDIKKNYPFYLTPTTVNSKEGFRSLSMDNVNLTYDLRIINSCAERKGKALEGGLKGRQLRDLLSISYFSQMLSSPYYNFNAVQPYLISFSKLYLGVDFLIPPNDILKAFNGNLVSLSNFEPTTEEIWMPEIESEEYFKIVVKPSVAPSLGLGFVRGIDCVEKKIYLITHLSSEILKKVNCLSLGNISPPYFMLLKQDTIETQPVYLSMSSLDVIRRVKRMFRVPAAPQFGN